MRYAIVENNVCVNVAESESALLPNWHQSNTSRKGDEWDGSVFKTPDLTLNEAQAVAAEKLAERVIAEAEKEFTAGSITTSLVEMKENQHLLDGDGDVTLNLKAGQTLITAEQQPAANKFIKNRFKAIRNREGAIAKLLEAETTADGVIDTLKAEINSGWPA